VNPTGFPASVAGSGTSITPTTGLNVNNQPGSISGTTNISTSASTPGLPNTGMGGNALSSAALALMTLLGIAAVYTARLRMR
jgi:LPXTG-motif cell wall-anchored protein